MVAGVSRGSSSHLERRQQRVEQIRSSSDLHSAAIRDGSGNGRRRLLLSLRIFFAGNIAEQIAKATALRGRRKCG
ncbi:hypothetical protein BHM03_00043135 [Ensete ventricosum]|nr:hypothetical protein BHM03_00043135 [Ensete ventricosum]